MATPFYFHAAGWASRPMTAYVSYGALCLLRSEQRPPLLRRTMPAISAILPIGLTPNDPRGGVRIRPISGRGSMTPIVEPATSACRQPGRVHVPFLTRRRPPDYDGGLLDGPGPRDAPRFHGLPPAVWLGANPIGSSRVMGRRSRLGPARRARRADRKAESRAGSPSRRVTGPRRPGATGGGEGGGAP